MPIFDPNLSALPDALRARTGNSAVLLRRAAKADRAKLEASSCGRGLAIWTSHDVLPSS